MTFFTILGIPYPESVEVIDADQVKDLADAIDALFAADILAIQDGLRPPGARVRSTANQAFANATDVTCVFGAEDYDVGGMANLGVNNERLTIQHDGYYLVNGGIRLSATPTTTTELAAWITQNGAGNVLGLYRSTGHNAGSVSLSVVLQCVAGDVIRLMGRWEGTVSPAQMGGTGGGNWLSATRIRYP